MKLSDFKGLFNTAHITLVHKQGYADDQFVFEFNAENLRWTPGEHAIFTLPTKRIHGRKWRALSIASTPEEGVIRIATRISDKPSSFKSVLKNLKVGEAITLRGPFGWFYRKDTHTPMVMVALGVGITPIRAMAQQHANGTAEAPMHIIYAARTEHLFQKSLDKASEKNPNITVDYVHTSNEVNIKLDEQIALLGDKANYYISGASGAVRTLRKRLRLAKIPRSRIISDWYLGY